MERLLYGIGAFPWCIKDYNFEEMLLYSKKSFLGSASCTEKPSIVAFPYDMMYDKRR
jgi:hypothetical protein